MPSCRRPTLILIDNGTGTTVETKSGAGRQLRVPQPAAGPLPDHGDLSGIQPRDHPGSRRRDRALDRPRRPVRGRRRDRAGPTSRDDRRSSRRRRRPIANTVSNAADREAAAGRPQHPRTSRCSCRAQRQSAGGARQRVQRPAGRRDQHHARRRQQQLGAVPQRRHELLRLRADPPGRDRRSDGLDRGPDRRRRRRRRGADPVRDQARHERVPRPGVRSDSERQAERERRRQQGARPIPKTKLRQHEWGANFGGPIIRNKLFFFGNYEQIYAPSETTLDRTVLTAEAQQGIFRYSGADNIDAHRQPARHCPRRTALPATIDPFVAAQFAGRQRRARPGQRRADHEPPAEHLPLRQSATCRTTTSIRRPGRLPGDARSSRFAAC